MNFLFSLLVKSALTWCKLLSQNKSTQILAVNETLQGLTSSVLCTWLHLAASEPPLLHDSWPKAGAEPHTATFPPPL